LHIDGTALRLMRMDEVTCPGGLPEREEAAVSPTLSTQHSALTAFWQIGGKGDRSIWVN
jgi:hypothetical protein